MKFKYCGLTRPIDIEAANEMKPDYVGFVFAQSRRHVDDMQAQALRALLNPQIQAVGVFVNDTIEHIASLVRNNIIDIVQLHGEEDMDDIQKLRQQITAPIIRAVRVQKTADIEQAACLPVDFLLFDTYVNDIHGGSGKMFDWSLIAQIDKPFFLAGGLQEDNISKALLTGAYALDISSGIETNGIKDIHKMRRIAAMIRREKTNE